MKYLVLVLALSIPLTASAVGLGDSGGEVLAELGKPIVTHTKYTRKHIIERWVYKYKVVYIKNNKVIKIRLRSSTG